MKKLEARHTKGGMGYHDSVVVSDEHGNDVLVSELSEAGKIAANAAFIAFTLAGYSIYRDGRCIAGTLQELMA